jgi:hypothetical protein
LRSARPSGFSGLLLAEGDGEKKRISQQQSRGFPHEGTTHRFRILLQKEPLITQISQISVICAICGSG